MEIVAAFACSHAGYLITHFEQASRPHRDAVYEGFARMQQAITEARPEALLVVATDHGRIYPMVDQPQFVIGVGATARGIGDAGLPPCEVRIHQQFAQAVLEGCIEEGVDLAYSEDVAIDHSFVTPLMLATPRLDLPIVPLAQNTRLPPMPTLRRSYEVGLKIGAAIRRGPSGRIVVIGTGGLSHWVGGVERRAFLNWPAGTRLAHQAEFPLVLPETGPINEAFDREFLAALERGGARAFIEEWPHARIDDEAGNGAQEIRNWLLIAGIVKDAPAQVLAYAAVPEWLTGSAVAQFRV